MSFILDALRKSEHERRRGAVPGILQVPFALPRARLPLWVPVAIAALAVALAVTGVAWWQAAGVPGHPTAADSSPAAPARTPTQSVTAGAPLPGEHTSPRVAVYSRDGEPLLVADVAQPAAVSAFGAEAPAAANPPEPAAGSPPARTAASPEPGPRAAELPLAQTLAATGDVPPLTLQLHAYDADRAKRFVIVNTHKYVEGQMLREGPEVVAIEERGVVLRQHGRDFRLLPN